jgi:hypothetical protein
MSDEFANQVDQGNGYNDRDVNSVGGNNADAYSSYDQPELGLGGGSATDPNQITDIATIVENDDSAREADHDFNDILSVLASNSTIDEIIDDHDHTTSNLLADGGIVDDSAGISLHTDEVNETLSNVSDAEMPTLAEILVDQDNVSDGGAGGLDLVRSEFLGDRNQAEFRENNNLEREERQSYQYTRNGIDLSNTVINDYEACSIASDGLVTLMAEAPPGFLGLEIETALWETGWIGPALATAVEATRETLHESDAAREVAKKVAEEICNFYVSAASDSDRAASATSKSR